MARWQKLTVYTSLIRPGMKASLLHQNPGPAAALRGHQRGDHAPRRVGIPRRLEAPHGGRPPAPWAGTFPAVTIVIGAPDPISAAFSHHRRAHRLRGPGHQRDHQKKKKKKKKKERGIAGGGPVGQNGPRR